jgi:hypothetical protein
MIPSIDVASSAATFFWSMMFVSFVKTLLAAARFFVRGGI